MLKVGVPQVVLSGAGAALVTAFFVDRIAAAIFVGMLVSMSSTAIVFKVLNDRGELSSPQGRIAVAVLLFQDLLVIVFMLLIPVLARPQTSIRHSLSGLVLPERRARTTGP